MHADINLASRPWLPCHFRLAHPVKSVLLPVVWHLCQLHRQ
jgi:hypothetical protein